MACKLCDTTTFIKDNGIDLFFLTETWLSAQGDKVQTVELATTPTSIVISWRWNCYNIQIYIRL